MRPEEACGGEATRAVGALAVSIGNPYVPGSSVLCCAVLEFLSFLVNGFTGSGAGVLLPVWAPAGMNGQWWDIGSVLV
jgi:hypothetical protein